MNLAQLIPLVGCVWNLLLALFVLARGIQARPNRVYFCLGLAIAVWNFGQYQLFVAQSSEDALLWAKVLWLGVIFIPVLLFHLALLIAELPVFRLIWITYAATLALAATLLTDWFLQSVRSFGAGNYYAVGGPAFPVFLLLFSLVFVSLLILLRQRRLALRHRRSRLDALILAQGFLILLGSNDLLPFLGIDRYPFTQRTVYPYGSIAAVFYGIIIAYSVLHHHIIDVQVTLSRAAAQIVRFAFLVIIGVILLLVASLLAPGEFNSTSFLLSLAVLLLSAIIASVFFPRLFGGQGEGLERRILGDRFEYHDQITGFIQSAQWHTESRVLLDELHDLLVKGLRVEAFQIILLDAGNRALSLLLGHPATPPRAMETLEPDSPLFAHFDDRRVHYLASAATAKVGASATERGAREQLAEFDAQFCFPLRSGDTPFGLLLLGHKSNGYPFTANDLVLLLALASHLSLVINQIRLKGEILRAQELDLLGRMSRGMAHDLNNLLTPVQTTLHLAHEGTPVAELTEALLPLAVRNVTTMRAYIRDALFFSENLRLDFERADLGQLVRMGAETMQAKALAKAIHVDMDLPDKVPVLMDAVLIQRLVANILSNAIDASAPGSSIRIHLAHLPRPDPDREWLRLRVTDEGEGIAPENLERIFTPYFTTKNRGDAARGFGLGLAICRQIIDLHGGILDVRSERGIGTTLIVELPDKPLASLIPPESESELAYA